jgi:hypothetical protein
MVYTAFIDGYRIEWTQAQGGTYGTSTITAQGDATYLWGAIGQKSVHPSPVTEMIYRASGINTQEVEAGALWKGKEVLKGVYGMVVLNAIPIWSVMGKSSTAGPVGGIYTHTITPTTATNGVLDLLPSFCIQHELSGDSTDYQVQFTGVKTSGLTLFCNFDDKVLMAVMNFIAQKSVKGAVGALTNAPILPPTSNDAPYHFNNMTRTWDYGSGNVALDGLHSMEFNINPDLEALYADLWDGATYKGRNLYKLIEGPRKRYTLKLQYHQEASGMWEELIATGNTKEMYFKFTRHSTEDYIEMTLTDCQVISHELVTPELGQPLLEEVIIEPRAVSFTVKDKIVGTHYGE